MNGLNLANQIQICLARFIHNKLPSSRENKIIDRVFKLLLDQQNKIIDTLYKEIANYYNQSRDRYNLDLLQQIGQIIKSFDKDYFEDFEQINVAQDKKEIDRSTKIHSDVIQGEKKWLKHPSHFLKISDDNLDSDKGINKAYLAIRAIKNDWSSDLYHDYDFTKAKEKYLGVWRIKKPYIMLNYNLEKITTKNGLNNINAHFPHGILIENIQYEILGKNHGYRSKMISEDFNFTAIQDNEINFKKLEKSKVAIAIKLNKNTCTLRDFIANNNIDNNIIPVNFIQTLLFAKICNHWDFHIENILVNLKDQKLKFIIIDYDNFLYEAGLPMLQNIIDLLKKNDMENFKLLIFKIFNFNFPDNAQNEEIKKYRQEFKDYNQSQELNEKSIFNNQEYWNALNNSNIVCFTQKEELFIKSMMNKLTDEQIKIEIIEFTHLLDSKKENIFNILDSFTEDGPHALTLEENAKIQDYFSHVIDSFLEIATSLSDNKNSLYKNAIQLKERLL